MKAMYEFPRLEISTGQERVHAQIIGSTSLGKRLQSLLKNQEVAALLIEDAASVNLSRHSDYVYWLRPDDKIPPVLANYLKSSQAKLIIVSSESETGETINASTHQLLTHLLDAGLDACLVFVRDIYGPSVGDSNLSLIWRDLKSKFTVNLPDDDAAEIYPIYIDDAAAAIIKISFSTQTYGRTFYIAGADKTTVLSFSYRLREEVIRQTQKLPAINYTQSPLRPSSFGLHPSAFDSASTRAFLSWRPDTDLSAGLKKLVSGVNPAHLAFSRRAGREASDRTAVDSGSAAVELMRAPESSRRNFIKKKTTYHFRRAFVIPAVLATVFFAATLSLPRLLDYLAASLAKTSPDRLARYEPLFTFFGRRQQFSQNLAAAALNLKQSELSALASALLQSVTDQSLTPPVDILNKLESKNTSLLTSLPVGDNRRLLGLGRELIPAVSPILTSPRKQTLAVVFQNSAELRPTGGYISLVAFVTLQKGKILDIDYQTVDQLDSQLVGTEVPPDPIKTYLGETNWRLRDANWAADPRQSAQKLQDLIARATGRSLTGVIFLTTPALEQILAQTGEIAAPDGTVWNHLNLPERLVYNDPAPQFASLAKALEEFVKINPRRQKILIGALKALDRQDLLISLLRHAEAPTPGRGEGGPDSPDHLQIIDANLGANKSDYFMTKEHDISVSLSPSQISSAVTLRYFNSASSSQYPAGNFRNYVRVFLPADAVVTSVVRLAPDGLVAVSTDNIIDAGRKSVGWFLEIPPGNQEIFRLEYTRPAGLIFIDQIAPYDFAISKQPGTAVPVSVSIDYPQNLIPLAVSENVTVAGNKLLAIHSGDTDLNLNVEFASISENSENFENQNVRPSENQSTGF